MYHRMCVNKRILAGITFVLGLYGSTPTANYYIDVNNAGASDGNPGTTGQPWATITQANTVLQAGDTVYIREGTYTGQYIEPDRSGTGEFNRIVYRNYPGDSVVVREAARAVFLQGKSYITVHGITFYDLDNFMDIRSESHHNIVQYCVFDRMRSYSTWRGSRIDDNSRYNWVHHCSFSRYGYYTSGDDPGCVFEIGLEQTDTDKSYFNLVEDNTFYYGGHHVFGMASGYNVVRNNYVHNEAWSGGYGNRCMQTYGKSEVTKRNLIERNRLAFGDIPSDDAGGSGLKLSAPNSIVRYNCMYHCTSAGIDFIVISTYPGISTDNYVYHNTVYHNGYGGSSYATAANRCGIGFMEYSGTPISGNTIKNNIIYGNYGGNAYGTYRYADLGEQTFAGNFEEAGDPLFTDIAGTPGPFDPSKPDFNLRAGSPCIDAGSALTRTDGSGSGTEVTLDNASYFCDGWGIVGGDEVIVGNNTPAVITGIDFTDNIITLDKSVAWNDNDPVNLAYLDDGPDQGAHEYGRAGLWISGAALPYGQAGEAYRGQLRAENGNGSPVWSITSGALPAGLSLSSDGMVTGTPAAAGLYHCGVRVADADTNVSRIITLPIDEADDVITIEAESGTILSAYEVGSDAAASGGYYISVPAGVGRSSDPTVDVRYTFDCPHGGPYYVWVLIHGYGGGNRRTYARLNGGDFYRSYNTVYDGYLWAAVENAPFVLNRGNNTLELGHGDELARIDKILLSKNPDYDPTGTGLSRDGAPINVGRTGWRSLPNPLSIRQLRNGLDNMAIYGLNGSRMAPAEICRGGMYLFKGDDMSVKAVLITE